MSMLPLLAMCGGANDKMGRMMAIMAMQGGMGNGAVAPGMNPMMLMACMSGGEKKELMMAMAMMNGMGQPAEGETNPMMSMLPFLALMDD
jgi:hypothetical protein